MKNIVILGIGHAGIKIASLLPVEYKKVYITTDKNIAEEYPAIQIGKRICQGMATSGDMNLGELALKESKDEVLESIKNYENILIVSPLGGGTSCGATKRVVEYASDLGKSIVVFVSLPSSFEGLSRLSNAVLTKTFLDYLCPVVTIERYNKISSTKRVSAKEVFETQEKLFLEKIKEYLQNN